ncbi:MAG TPA: signal recognition particle receptor subunit alpha, partial [Oryzihumus sp.]|nr:signal recognition particle receptor subunit alpha [Oryzihumus sp.]
MSQTQEILALVVLIALAGVGLLVGLLRSRGGKDKQLPPQAPSAPPVTREPSVGDESAPPRDTPKRTVETSPGVDLLEPPVVEPVPAPTVETPAPAVGRLQRLRARLARSNSAMGQGLLSLLSRGGLDEQTWEDVEDTLLTSDLGVEATTELVDSLRTRVKVEGATDEATVREWLR